MQFFSDTEQYKTVMKGVNQSMSAKYARANLCIGQREKSRLYNRSTLLSVSQTDKGRRIHIKAH